MSCKNTKKAGTPASIMYPKIGTAIIQKRRPRRIAFFNMNKDGLFSSVFSYDVLNHCRNQATEHLAVNEGDRSQTASAYAAQGCQ